MKKLFLAVAAATVLLLPLSAQASEKTGFYIAPKFVLSIQHTDNDFSWEDFSDGTFNKSVSKTRAGAAIALGYNFAPKFNLPIRAEIEYGMYGRTSESGTRDRWMEWTYKTEIKTLLANVYWDITEWNGFTPYVGAGLGVAFVDSQCNIYDNEGDGGYDRAFGNTETVFAWQVGLGCSYAFNDTVSLDLGYRFLMTGDGKTSAKLAYGDRLSLKTKDNRAHQFMLGLRVTF